MIAAQKTERKVIHTYAYVHLHVYLCVRTYVYTTHTRTHTCTNEKQFEQELFFYIFFLCGGTVDQTKHSNEIRTTHILANVHALSHIHTHTQRHKLISAKCKRNCVTQAPLCRCRAFECVCECGVRVVW